MSLPLADNDMHLSLRREKIQLYSKKQKKIFNFFFQPSELVKLCLSQQSYAMFSHKDVEKEVVDTKNASLLRRRSCFLDFLG